MPIGGSAYYDKFKKNQSAKTQPPAASGSKLAAASEPTSAKQEKVLRKSTGYSNRVLVSAKRMPRGAASGKSRSTDPGALDDVVSQILDLAQRVHAVAGQAEAAVLRAEAAVMKAEVAVGKSEAASSRADASFSKCDVAVSRSEAAAFKSDAAAKRAELSAGKAGMAAGKSELAAGGRDNSGILMDAADLMSDTAVSDDASASDDEDNRTKSIDSPISQIAVMSMKLRSGMRQIEEERERSADRNSHLRPGSNLNMAVGREDIASGLVSLDNDTMLPRVAPFIMDEGSQEAESATPKQGEPDKSTLNGVGSAA